MAEKQIFEREHDTGAVSGFDECNKQFDLLGKRIEKFKIELKSVFDCSEYISKEIQCEFDNISMLLEWNKKRINLLNEMNMKYRKINENIIMLYDEMFNLILYNNNINKIETQK